MRFNFALFACNQSKQLMAFCGKICMIICSMFIKYVDKKSYCCLTHLYFREGQVATCWYILLSGCVFLDEQVCLPCGWYVVYRFYNIRNKNGRNVKSSPTVLTYPEFVFETSEEF